MARRVTPTLRESAIEYAAWLTRQRRANDHALGCRNLIFRLAKINGNPKVGSLRGHHIEAFFDRHRDVAPATWNQYRYLFKGWLRFCQGRGWHSFAPSL